MGVWLPEVGDNPEAACREKRQVGIMLLWGQDPLFFPFLLLLQHNRRARGHSNLLPVIQREATA